MISGVTAASMRQAPRYAATTSGVLLHFGGRAHRQHPSIIQRDDAIGDAVDQRHVVLDHQHGDAELALHVADPERHVVGLLDIEAGRRLIEQDQLRLRAQRARQLDHLAHAIGQAGDQLIAIGFEIEELDDLLDPAAMHLLVGPHARQEQELLPELRGRVPVTADQEVGEHGRVLEQLDVLEGAGDAELGDVVRRLFGDILILEEDAARGRPVDPRDQVEDRALAGAVGTDNREDLALLDRERDRVDRFQPSEMQRQILGAEIAHRFRSDFT
ncbi:hypothetical protein AB7M75_007583 [Bradyrhizobium ottawaense]